MKKIVDSFNLDRPFGRGPGAVHILFTIIFINSIDKALEK
jgi:hypothetical protein